MTKPMPSTMEPWKDLSLFAARHPQYMGIFVAIVGQLIHWPTILTLLLFPLIVWAYYRLAKAEERRMLEQVGAPYAVYQQQVPMFWPKRENWKRFLAP